MTPTLKSALSATICPQSADDLWGSTIIAVKINTYQFLMHGTLNDTNRCRMMPTTAFTVQLCIEKDRMMIIEEKTGNSHLLTPHHDLKALAHTFRNVQRRYLEKSIFFILILIGRTFPINSKVDHTRDSSAFSFSLHAWIYLLDTFSSHLKSVELIGTEL